MPLPAATGSAQPGADLPAGGGPRVAFSLHCQRALAEGRGAFASDQGPVLSIRMRELGGLVPQAGLRFSFYDEPEAEARRRPEARARRGGAWCSCIPFSHGGIRGPIGGNLGP